MTAATLIADLSSRGMALRLDGEGLIVTPSSLLSDADREMIRARKSELIDLLTSGHLCPGCAAEMTLQDRALDTWWCPACRRWSDGQGRALAGSGPPKPKPKPISGDQDDARKLLEDLLAAGCAFRIEEGELRLQYPSRISAGLWVRFQNAGDAFIKLARETAERKASSPD